jgi:hypothetical protein
MVGWKSLGVVLDVFLKEKNIYPCRDWNYGPYKPVSWSLYQLSYLGFSA